MGTGYQNGWYTINADISCLWHFYHWERERERGGEREGRERKGRRRREDMRERKITKEKQNDSLNIHTDV